MAYLQFAAGPDGPFQTVEAKTRVSVSQRAEATYHELHWEGRWRRVFAGLHPAPRYYVNVGGERVPVTFLGD